MQYQQESMASGSAGVSVRRRERSAARPRIQRLKRWLRRAHLYAGLVMLPWVLFFGISGMLFNHPSLGADVQGERVAPADLAAVGELEPWDAKQAAQRVVAGLNATGRLGSFELDPGLAPHFTGFTVLTAPAPEGRYMLVLDVERASGVLVTRRIPQPEPGVSLPATQLRLPELTTRRVEEQVKGLLAARDKAGGAELKAHPKIAPELRLRARDAQGDQWNLTYHAGTGEVTGRRSDAFPPLEPTQLLSMMHTTHHFTLGLGPLWFWALFEDLLGLTMVFWAVSGLVMWWQVKATRVAGAISFAVALVVAGVVMGGTLQHLTFGDVEPTEGPGE